MSVLDVNKMAICQKIVLIPEFVEILYLYFINQNNIYNYKNLEYKKIIKKILTAGIEPAASTV
jgi:hypothetical protein